MKIEVFEQQLEQIKNKIKIKHKRKKREIFRSIFIFGAILIPTIFIIYQYGATPFVMIFNTGIIIGSIIAYFTSFLLDWMEELNII